MFSILVVEDDLDLLEMITAFLSAQGYQVLSAVNGEAGYQIFKQEPVDLIISDWMLPILDGYQLAQMIRRESEVPFIFLTAVADETRQVQAYDLKIDEYIVKPFSYNLLVKRVEAVLRRTYPQAETINGVRLDLAARKVFEGEQEILLTTREFDILAYFFKNVGYALTRESIIQQIWQTDFMGDPHIVDTHIKNLRKKIPSLRITAVKGVGYRFEN